MNHDFMNLFIRNVNKANLENILKYHKNSSNIAFFEYKKNKDKLIDEEISLVKKVYLDTRFWIEMRNAIHKSEPKKPGFKELFQILKNLVDQQEIVCPFSNPLFEELLKQNIVNSRMKTAQIVDILSNNYSFKPIHYIISCEVYNLVSNYAGIPILMKNYIWSKAISILGDLDFNTESHLGQEEDELVLKKAYYDIFLNLTFQEIVVLTESIQKDISVASLNADVVNQTIAAFANEEISFQKLHKREISSSYKSIAESMNWYTIDFSNIISKFGMEKLRNITPVIYIYSAIYSHFQIDKRRKMKPNDYYDISHSSLALATCDYFFTEKSFCKLLKSLKLDSKFNTIVESDPIKIIELLQD